MGYSIGTIPAYTEQDAKNIIRKMIAEGTTASLMTIQSGIKSSETINIFTSELVWQANSACGFNASGSTTGTQRTLTVGKIKLEGSWCEQELEPLFYQKAMKAGSTYDMLTYRNEIVDDIVMNYNKRKEVAIWQGDLTSVNAYLNKFDGLCVQIAGASPIVATPVTWSVANSRTALQNVYAKISDDMLVNKNLKVFMGTAEARDYRMKLGIDNLYHITGSENKLYLENTDVEIVPVIGLSGTKKIYAIATDNMFLGTDLESETDALSMAKLFYAVEADQLRFSAKLKMGVNIAFGDQVVSQLNS